MTPDVVLVAKLVMCRDRLSMAIRTFLTENHPCILDCEQFAESFVREELTETIGCNPDRLLTSF